MNINDLHQSKLVRGILIGLGIAILVLLIFKAGEAVGYRKAHFSERAGDNFHRAFVNPNQGPMGSFLDGFAPGGHGAAGKIVSIALPNIVVAGPDNLEKTIILSDDTLVRKYRDQGTKNDLAVGDFVVVLGEPTANGEVAAKLIRIMPSPDMMRTK